MSTERTISATYLVCQYRLFYLLHFDVKLYASYHNTIELLIKGICQDV